MRERVSERERERERGRERERNKDKPLKREGERKLTFSKAVCARYRVVTELPWEDMPLFRNTPAPDTEGDLPLDFPGNFPGLLGMAESDRDLELLSLDPIGVEVGGEEEEREGGGEE